MRRAATGRIKEIGTKTKRKLGGRPSATVTAKQATDGSIPDVGVSVTTVSNKSQKATKRASTAPTETSSRDAYDEKSRRKWRATAQELEESSEPWWNTIHDLMLSRLGLTWEEMEAMPLRPR
jgi:hypothetical protein